MAPLILLFLLFGIVVTAQDNKVVIDDLPLHPGVQRYQKRQEQRQMAACEQEVRTNYGEDFCYEYYGYPRARTVYSTYTTTRYGRPVTRTVMDATMETYTKTRTETEDVSYTATTITTTITAPPTPTMTIFRRDDAPVPWYLRRKCNRRQLHAACRNIIEQYPSTTVTRTRTRTAYERPTIFSTRTYTRWRVTRTTTTTYLSTSTVTAIETSTVPHPCDDPSNTIRRVLAAGVRGSNITPEENGESIGATECCRRCWDESQCNGWAYFDGWHCLRMVSVPSTGTTETCPNGFPDWTVMTSASGVDQDVSGQGPCARIMEEDE